MAAMVDGIRVVGRAWGRFTVLWAFIVLAGATFTTVVGTFADDILRAQADTVFDNGALTPGGTLIVFLELGLPVLLVVLLLLSLGAGAGSRMADDLLAERGARVWASLRRGLPVALTILLTGLAHGLGVFVAVLATPFLVPVGLVGLVVMPLLRRLRPSVGWPDTRTLLVMAVPFAGAAILAVRWAVAIPAAALERLSVRAALRRSWDLTRGSEPAAALALLGGIGLQVLMLLVVDVVRDSSLPELLQSVIALVGPMLAMSIPIAVLTVLFRRLAPGEPEPTDGDGGPSRSSTPGWLARFARPPAVSVLVLIVGLLGGMLAVSPPLARAVVADITVDDLGDAAALTNTDACTNGAPGCTLRAALAVATTGQTIGFSVSGEIRPATPLPIDTAVTIDGDGQRIELNGDGCLTDGCSPPDHVAVASTGASGYALRNLTVTTADWTAAGAAVLSSADGQLDRVTFTASNPGAVEIAAGHLVVVNTTFHSNGFDVLVGPSGTADVAFSTFHDTAGTAISSAGGLTTVSASIIAPFQTATPPAACAGTTAGALPNVDTDGTCGGTPVGTLGSFGDHGGWVNTVAIDAASLAVDIVPVADCPATDARGVLRDQATCDLGAFEYVGATQLDLVVDATGDAGDADPDDLVCDTGAGECTLRAAVEQANAKDFLPTTITFASDLAITVASALPVTRDLTVAGTGHVVSVSGADATSILDVAAGAEVGLTDLHLTGGSTADAAGGGAIRSSGDLTLTNVSISDSTASAGRGHAIAVLDGTLSMVNATLDANEGASGHAISVAPAGTADILHSTIRATSGALGADAGATVTLRSSIVSAGSPACAGTIGGGDSQVTDASCPGTVSADVGLGTFEMHGGVVPTIALEISSPAVDAAPAPACPTHDARGVERPQLDACDAGSYELEPIVTGPVTFVVDDLSDLSDDDPDDGQCDTGIPGNTCTLRAALEQANARTAASPVDAPAFTVTFATGGTIDLDTQLELSAAVTIDGGTEGVTLDGGGTHRVLDVQSSSRPWEVRNLTVANGQATDGGAGIRSRAPGTITNTTFTGNTVPAGASAGGGAVAALARTLAIVNATFSQNADAVGGSADIDAAVPVSVRNSTLVDSSNRRISGTVELVNSLVLATRDDACAGTITGHHNIVPPACGPSLIPGSPTVGTFGDHGGPVQTLGLVPASEAIGAADPADCPAADARGFARDGACDIGASEYVWDASLDVSLPPSSAHGVAFDIDVVHVPTHDEGFGSGTITVTSDLDGVLVADQALVDGATTIVADGLSEGDHVLTVDYSGDANFPTATSDVDHTVRPPAVQDLTIDPLAAVFGQEVTLTSTISDPAASGDVTFTSSLGRVETAPLVAGVATLALDDLEVGEHEFVASHTGDAAVPDTASAPVTVTISPAPTSLALSGPATSEFGEPVVLTADVSADAPSTATPAGSVTFFDGTTPLAASIALVGGQAELSTSLLPVGLRDVRAVFTPTSSFVTSDDSLPHTVSSTPTTTTLTGPATATALGELAEFQVAVTRTNTGGRTPTGTVVVYVDAVERDSTLLDGLGEATFGFSDLSEGEHTVLVEFVADTGFVDSDDTVLHTVDLRPTTTTLTGGSGGALRTGQAVTFTVAVVDDGGGAAPAGDVELTFGGVLLDTLPLTSGAVTFDVEVPPLAGNSAWVVATYLGNPLHAGSQDEKSQLIAPAEVTVTLTPDPAITVPGDSVDLRVDLTPVAPGAGVPTGTVVVRNTTTGAVVGQGTIDGSRTFSVTAGFNDLPIGNNDLTATFTPDAGWASFDPPATTSVFVDLAVPEITTTITPVAPERGTAANVSVAVDGVYGPAPSGTVTVYVDTVPIGDPVDISQAGAGVNVNVGDVGTRDVLVQFSGTPDVYEPGEQRTPLAVAPTPTETQVTWNGHDTTWFVDVWNRGEFGGDYTGLAPTGHASMWVDGVRVARAALTSQAPVPLASLTFDYELLPGLHEVTVRYEPVAGFAESLETNFYDLARLNGSLAIDDPGVVPWGDIEVGGELITPSTGDPTPTGSITYAIGSSSCTAPAAGGSCLLPVDEPGTYEVSAAWPGDDNYVPDTSARTIEVTRQQVDATLDVTAPRFVTGEPVTVAWNVDGPASGAITVETQRRVGGPSFFGWNAACTGSLAGACTVTLPYLACELCEDWIRIAFAGDDLYEPVEVMQQLDLTTCFPVNLLAEPAGAQLVADIAPNCGAGTGYLDGTTIAVSATAPPGVPQQWEMFWDGDFHGYFDGGEALARPRQFEVVWNSRDWTPSPSGLTTRVEYRVGLCAPVVLEATAYRGRVFPITEGLEPNCPSTARTANLPQGWSFGTEYIVDGLRAPVPRLGDLGQARQPTISMATAWFALGTEVPTPTYDTTFTSDGDAGLYGHSIDGQPVASLDPADRVVTLDGLTIGATFGPPCTPLDFDAGAGAEYSVDPPRLCGDPWSGVDDGWLEGEAVDVTVEPPGTQYMVDAVTDPRWSSDLQCVGCLDGFDLIHHTRNLLVGPGGILTDTSASPATVTPEWAQCRELVIDPQGESATDLVLFNTGGIDGVYQLSCPNRSANDGWHAAGHPLTLKVEGEPGFRFGQWGHEELDALPLPWWSRFGPESPTIDIVMDEDLTLYPSFFRPGTDCHDVRIVVDPRSGAGLAGTVLHRVTVEVDAVGGTVCPTGNVLDGPSDELEGWLPSGRLQVTGEVVGGTPLSGWRLGTDVLATPEEPGDTFAPEDILGSPVATHGTDGTFGLNVDASRGFVTFSVCSQITTAYVVELADGQRTLGIDEAGDFVQLTPEPNCAFDDEAWTVGSEVALTNVADPVMFEKVALDGTPGVQSLPFTVDGASANGFKFADYRMVCHTLTLGGESGQIHDLPAEHVEAFGLPYDWTSRVETTPMANCPNTDARDRQYVGGTEVYLEGHVPDDHVRQGWQGDDVELLDAGDTMANAPIVRVTMDQDRFAQFNYRDMTDGEKAEDFFVSAARDVTEAVGNLVKKATGALALGMTQYIMGNPPISYMLQPGEMFGAMGGLFSASAWISNSVLDLLDIPHDPIGPPFCPAGVEIGSDECSWFPQEIDVTLAALDSLAAMAVSGGTCTAVWGFSGNGSYAGDAVSMIDELTSLASSVKDGLSDAADAAAEVRQMVQRQEQYLAAVTAARAAYDAQGLYGDVTETTGDPTTGESGSLADFEEIMGQIQFDDLDSLTDLSAMSRCIEEQIEETTEALARLGI